MRNGRCRQNTLIDEEIAEAQNNHCQTKFNVNFEMLCHYCLDRIMSDETGDSFNPNTIVPTCGAEFDGHYSQFCWLGAFLLMPGTFKRMVVCDHCSEILPAGDETAFIEGSKKLGQS